MPTETSNGFKACCACGADVAGQARMKDSQGRYWCLPCGEADQKKRALASPNAPCAGCHQQFSKGKLDRLGEHFYCKACLKKRTRGGSHASPAKPAVAASTHLHGARHGGAAVMHPGASADHRRAIMMAAFLALLIVFALLYHFVILAE